MSRMSILHWRAQRERGKRSSVLRICRNHQSLPPATASNDINSAAGISTWATRHGFPIDLRRSLPGSSSHALIGHPEHAHDEWTCVRRPLMQPDGTGTRQAVSSPLSCREKRQQLETQMITGQLVTTLLSWRKREAFVDSSYLACCADTLSPAAQDPYTEITQISLTNLQTHAP